MREHFHEALTVMENSFERLEKQVQPPQIVKWLDSFVLRHMEQTIHQALIQKLARNISGLHAIDVLLSGGFLQEQGVLHRTLDEIREDIFFLAAALTNDKVTDLHRDYLAAFFAEEFDQENQDARPNRPNNVPRKKIRAYVTRILSTDPNPSKLADMDEKIASAYSGFVHASSPQIMDMCVGVTPKFHISGMLGTSRMASSIRDAWNYYYRGLCSTTIVAKAFGDKSLVDALIAYLDKFEKTSLSK